MPDPSWNCDSLTGSANFLLAVDHYTDLTLPDVEDFILRNVDMLKRDIALWLYNPFHDISCLRAGKTAECLFRDGICKGLIKVNSHKRSFSLLRTYKTIAILQALFSNS